MWLTCENAMFTTRAARVLLFSVVFVCLFVCLSACQHDNSWTVKDIIMKCLGLGRRADKLENGIGLHGRWFIVSNRKPNRIILGLTKGKGLYMASESLLSCISPFSRHLINQWPWVSRTRRGHSKSYILAAIESPCTTLYRWLIVIFALSSTVSEILPVLYAPCQLYKQVSK